MVFSVFQRFLLLLLSIFTCCLLGFLPSFLVVPVASCEYPDKRTPTVC